MSFDPIVEVKNLSVSLRGNCVVSDVSFEARAHEVLAIMGPNGSGKTTLLRALVGLVRSSGALRIAGRDLQKTSIEERATLVAYVPQQTELNTPLSVQSVVAHGRFAMTNGKDAIDECVAHAMQQVDVYDLRDKVFTELSGGEKRRVLLARALATQAPVLLLDEPASSLDIAHALQFYAVLRELATQKRAVVMALHNPHDAQRFTDRVLLLDRGQLIAQGTTAEILHSDALNKLYGIESRVESNSVFYVSAS